MQNIAFLNNFIISSHFAAKRGLSRLESFLMLHTERQIRPLDLPGHGAGSSVSIATDYGLDGPGSNTGGDEIFRPSRPALRPTQPPAKLVPGLSRE